MGATRFDITTTGDTTGSKILPVNVADVTYLSPALSIVSRRVTVYVEFFNASGVPVTPTGGTIHVLGRPMAQVWLAAVNSPINAVDVGQPVAAYTVPYMEGLVSRVGVRFIAVTGAASASVAVYREDA
jgi:hypothetical protein